MESFLRRKLALAGSNILSGSSLQKPVSSYQPIKLPDLCSSFYSIADEPFPQVSGFLDDTVGPSFLLNETGTVLNSPACTPSENQARNKDEGVLAPRKEATSDSGLNCSLGAHCQSANGSTSTRSPQNEKDITSATLHKADGDCNDAMVSTTSLEKSDLISAELKNSTFDVSQDSKERSDTGINATVDLHNIREKNSTSEAQEPKEGSDSRLNSTVDIDVPNTKTESGNTTVELVQSHDPKEGCDTGVNATVDISNLDSAQSKTKSCVDNTVPLNTTTEHRETEVEISTAAFVCSVDAPDDAPELNAEEHHKKTSSPGLVDAESIPSSDMGNISRNSIFCLDDTLDLKTSFLVTSTPIVFGKESRFEIMRDMKPRKRLSVINSIEAQSNDELVCASNHDGTDAVQVTESSSQSQKVSATCTLSHSTSEPANENKPPTKLPIKRQLPQLSSKLSYPKSSLPPRPQLSVNSMVAVKPKTLQGPPAPHQPDASSTTLLGNRKTVQMNKGKNIASASTVKTSMVSAVTGYNFTAVAKPSSSGIQQMKPSGLQPPTRKRQALKTPQATRSSVETVQTQPSNKSTGLPAPALSTVESDAVHAAEGVHGPGCVNCLRHQEKLEKIIQELMGLRSECKNWGPLHEKLEMCVEELKRI
uniref:Si:ch211-126c2.4 n=1 Tax=Cyprinus carpio TaxID=7962 RepID=A0A8C1R0I6_CYPCA